MSDFTGKYRSQKISELDLTSIREGLAKVLKSRTIPHAFLFCGPRGTGKTSAARIIAKAVNCLEKEKGVYPEGIARGEPCNACEQCLSITAGTNLDVLEIDAASNRGIDDIRDLREKIKLAPTQAKYKVYIIDEAHMLTIEAFNALLKTLEEPPRHAIFILCTTDPEKLPETIISRCMRFNFKRATVEEIVSKLSRIVAGERLEVEKEALREIAKASTGSFRDGIRLLEQVSLSETKVTREVVREILGQTVGSKPEKLLEFLVVKETKGGILEIGRVQESGANLKVYTGQLLEILRAGLLAKFGVSEEEILVTEGMGNLLNRLEVEEIKTLIEIFSRASRELKDALIPQLPLELGVVEWCGDGGGIGESVRQSADLGGVGEKKTFPSVAINQACPPEADERSTISTKRSDPKSVSLEEIQTQWREVMLAVRPKNHSVEALLRATRPIGLGEETLTLEVFYKFHKDQLETEKCRKIVEETLLEFWGRPIFLKCVLGQKPKAANYPVAAEPANPQPMKAPVPGNGETTDEDIIKVAEEIFSGIVE